MDKEKLLTRTMAVVATIMVWLPILLMVASFVTRLIMSGIFLGDYLIPGELFPLVLIGAGLLIWAALRARSHVKPLAWGTVTAVVGLVASQVVAIISGAASGEKEPTIIIMALMIGLMVVYILAEIFLGVTGIRLVKHLSTDIKAQDAT